MPIQRITHLISKENLFWRFFVYILGFFITAFAIALAINAALGVSPLNAFPYALSLATGIYLGACVAALFSVLVLLQILILRRDYKPIQLTQLLGSFVFGFFVEFARFLLGDFSIPTYFGQLTLLAMSIACFAVGISLYMSARLVPLPPAGLILAITQKTKLRFHQVNIMLDSTCVLIGITFSLIALGGIYGAREGTLFSAILIGKTMPYAQRALRPMLDKVGLAPPR